MATKNKTHPMVLIIAVGLTLFSILCSAVIAGLIPFAHVPQGMVQSLTDNTGSAMANGEIIAVNAGADTTSQFRNQHGVAEHGQH